MKKRVIITLFLIIATVLLVGCKRNKGIFDFDGYKYPNFPLADRDPNIDSWTQWDEDDIVELDWFIDETSLALPNEDSLVYQEVLRRTGVKINFRRATTNDGTELTTMIAGGDLPDIISVKSGMYDLINEGVIFPIQGLAERWAPSLLKRLENDEEMVEMYKYKDNKIYFLPQNFYSTADVEEYAKLGYYMLPAAAVLARKDYLDAFIAYKQSLDSTWTSDKMANPQGVLEMLLWVKNEFKIPNSNHSFVLTSFDASHPQGSEGLRVLMEYFSVYEEDLDGNYVYQQSTDNFKDMMLWLNELYRNNILTEGSLGASPSQVNTYIQNGEPIIYAGRTISPSSYFRNWELNVSGKNPLGYDARYVPIIFANSSGQVPQLAFLGAGQLMAMVTANCKRPDRAIQLLDFLWSDEGQELIYWGINSEKDFQRGTFRYTDEPGTTITLEDGTPYTYKYGQIEYMDEVKAMFNKNDVTGYGIYHMMVLCRPMYMYLSSANGGQFNNYRDYVKHNLKAALIPYTYNYRGFEFNLDPTDKRYKRSITINNNITSKWFRKYTEIIASSSSEEVTSMIDEMLIWAERAGLNELIEFKNDCFQKHKEALGIRYAWAPNDPNSRYHELTIQSIFGDTNHNVIAPEDIPRQ